MTYPGGAHALIAESRPLPIWRDGRIVGRMGICRVLDAARRDDGATPT